MGTSRKFSDNQIWNQVIRDIAALNTVKPVVLLGLKNVPIFRDRDKTLIGEPIVRLNNVFTALHNVFTAC